MDFARTIRKTAVAVLCSASLLLAFGSTAFAAPHSSSTPTYVPCSRVSLQQIKNLDYFDRWRVTNGDAISGA